MRTASRGADSGMGGNGSSQSQTYFERELIELRAMPSTNSTTKVARPTYTFRSGATYTGQWSNGNIRHGY